MTSGRARRARRAAGAPSRRGVAEEVRFTVSRTLSWLSHYTGVLEPLATVVYMRFIY